MTAKRVKTVDNSGKKYPVCMIFQKQPVFSQVNKTTVIFRT